MPDEKKAEIKPLHKVEPVKKPADQTKWRYYCDHCTNVAMWASDPIKFVNAVCPHCHMVVVYKSENWIKDH